MISDNGKLSSINQKMEMFCCPHYSKHLSLGLGVANRNNLTPGLHNLGLCRVVPIKHQNQRGLHQQWFQSAFVDRSMTWLRFRPGPLSILRPLSVLPAPISKVYPVSLENATELWHGLEWNEIHTASSLAETLLAFYEGLALWIASTFFGSGLIPLELKVWP